MSLVNQRLHPTYRAPVVVDGNITVHRLQTLGIRIRQLTPYVFRLALQQSGVDILEPMLYFELQIPQAASSKAITDLQKMMSEIEDISCNNEWCHIKGKVPLNTSKDYASEVSSYTKGLGVFMVKPCGYQITKGDYSDNIRMNEKDKLLFMFQKSMSSK